MARSDSERAPLLAPAVESTPSSENPAEEYVDQTDESDDPRQWPSNFKWFITVLLTFMAFAVTFNCISVVPIASHIVANLSDGQSTNRYASVILVTIWELGEAAGPLVLAPMSEEFGRLPVLLVANALFVLATVLGAVASSVPVYILSRVLCGLFVTSNILNPAIIGDMFEPEVRGSPMSLVMVAPIIGASIGPILGGIISESLSWRWVSWIAVILALVVEVLLFVFFRETYRETGAKRRRHRHTIAPGQVANTVEEQSVISKVDDDDVTKIVSGTSLVESIVRPFFIFSSSGVLMIISTFGSVFFAHYYNITTTLPDILLNKYGLSPSLTGTALLSASLGSIVSVAVCNSTLDKVYIRMKASHGGVGQPEFRLPISIVGGVTLPCAIAFYGWSAQLHLPLPVVLFACASVGVTLMIGFLPLAAYVVDAFGAYSASAMTGMIVSRCLMSTFLPLLTAPLVDHFGYGWAFTILAAFTLALAPIPVTIQKFGQQWRQRSKYTKTE